MAEKKSHTLTKAKNFTPPNMTGKKVKETYPYAGGPGSMNSQRPVHSVKDPARSTFPFGGGKPSMPGRDTNMPSQARTDGGPGYANKGRISKTGSSQMTSYSKSDRGYPVSGGDNWRKKNISAMTEAEDDDDTADDSSDDDTSDDTDSDSDNKAFPGASKAFTSDSGSGGSTSASKGASKGFNSGGGGGGVYPYNGPGPKMGAQREMEKNKPIPSVDGSAYPYGTGKPDTGKSSSSSSAFPGSSNSSSSNNSSSLDTSTPEKSDTEMNDNSTTEKKKKFPWQKDGATANESKVARMRTMKERIELKIKSLKESRRKRIGESLSYLLEFEASADLEKAELVLAAKAILDRLQKMAEELAKVEADDLMPMLDSLKAQFGPESAERFNNVVTQKLRGTIEALKQAKDGISTQIMELEGTVSGVGPTNDMAGAAMGNAAGAAPMAPAGVPGAAPMAPENDMGGMPADPALDPTASGGAPIDDGLGADTLGGDAANPAGRAKKESYIPLAARRLREAKNPDLMIFNAFRKALREHRNPVKCARFIVERYGIDHDELIRILKEGKKAKEWQKPWEVDKDKDKDKAKNAKKDDKKKDDKKVVKKK